MKWLLIGCAVSLVCGAACADVKLMGIFTDNMVLQRGKPVPVRGTANPGEEVSVAYAGKSAKATAGADGWFSAVLPPLEVEKTGKELVVTGKNRIVLKNVVVGDVWLVSGQSNAEMSFSWGIINGAAEMAKAKDYPNVRAIKFSHATSFFPVRRCARNDGPWKVATEKTLPKITAVGYFMARELNAKTGVPIGILDNNWSGCFIEPFVCEEGLRAVPELKNHPALKGVLDSLAKNRAKMIDWCGKVAALKEGDAFENLPPMPPAPFWTRQHNAMIEPLVEFPICGAVWYQGCANTYDGSHRYYMPKLKALIAGWRAKWGYDFPCYIVQLASYKAKTTDPAGGGDFAGVRNEQLLAAKSILNTGLAVAIDIGNAKDIHPKNKYDVGYRLSLWARRDVYGEKDLVVSGPIYRELKIEGDKARIIFDHVGSGLFAGKKGPNTPGVMPVADPDGKLRGFAIAGADKKWFWAEAVIDGNDVVVSSKDVPAPVAVRYAFRDNPMGDCSLYNKEGLPASPFRTDK